MVGLRDLYILAIAASPVLELRGAIPLAISLGYSPSEAFLLSFIGNLLPVPILLFLFSPICKKLRQMKGLKKFFQWLEERTRRKAQLVQKYKIIGLVLFVAIPFPTTGAWTGSFAASLFQIRFRHAIFAISLGIFIAGIIVTTLSAGGYALLR